MKLLFLFLFLTLSLSAHAENVIIKFYAAWCPPCKEIASGVKSVSEKLKIKVKAVDLDTDVGVALANRLGIQGIPTLILLKDGNEICRIIGYVDEKALLEKVKACFKTK